MMSTYVKCNVCTYFVCVILFTEHTDTTLILVFLCHSSRARSTHCQFNLDVHTCTCRQRRQLLSSCNQCYEGIRIQCSQNPQNQVHPIFSTCHPKAKTAQKWGNSALILGIMHRYYTLILGRGPWNNTLIQNISASPYIKINLIIDVYFDILNKLFGSFYRPFAKCFFQPRNIVFVI